MKTLLSLTLALSLGGASLISSARPTYAAETAAQRAGRAAIVAAYKKQAQATVKKDANAIMSFVAPDYQMFMLDGTTLNRARTDAMMRQTMSEESRVSLTYLKATPRIVSLTWRGKDAIVVVEMTGSGTIRSGQRSERFEQVVLSRDFWSSSPRAWKMRQQVERISKFWVNGQRIR
ncbi:MAG TPA: hypothetical protein VGB45_04955 [Abditibacterium sp.]